MEHVLLSLCRASNPTVTPSDIESSTQKIADEFTMMGIDLKTALKGKVRFLGFAAPQHSALSQCGSVGCMSIGC